MSLRDKILGAEDLHREKVDVKEWGETIYIREMTGGERDAYDASLIDKASLTTKEKLKNMRAELVVLCAVDEAGERIFSDEDVELVTNKNAKVLDRLADIAQVINKLSEDAIEAEQGN